MRRFTVPVFATVEVEVDDHRDASDACDKLARLLSTVRIYRLDGLGIIKIDGINEFNNEGPREVKG